MISLLAALGLLWPMSTAWERITYAPAAGIGLVALTAGDLGLMAAIAIAKTERRLVRLDRCLLVLGLLVLGVAAAVVLRGTLGYNTDEAAFDQGAGTLLLHGHDPYGANLTGALTAFDTPSPFLTYTMSGGFISSYGYPAFPMLLVAGVLQLAGGSHVVSVAYIFVVMLLTVYLFKVLPEGRRGAAVILCVAFPILSSFAIAGVNETLAMAFLVPVAVRWTSTGHGGVLSRGDRLRSVCLGLAAAANQLTWFIAPFLVFGIYLLRRGELGARRARRVTLSYLGVAAAAFAAVNVPFILWGPTAWLHGVLMPLTTAAIPAGQGIVDLTLYLRWGGGAIDAYDYAAACLYAALLILYLARFRTLARACFLLPLAALFVSSRSLGSYWLTPVAVIAVGALTSQEGAVARATQLAAPARWALPRWGRRAALAGLFLPTVVFLGIALATPEPFSMRILSARPGLLARVRELRVLVDNRSDQPLRPHFAVTVSGRAVIWQISVGPSVLAPGRSLAYWLMAPAGFARPADGVPFFLEAFTSSPQTFSSSSSFVAAAADAGTPAAVR